MSSSPSESSYKKLLEAINSDNGKKVLKKNKGFSRSWWRTWEEWHKKNQILLEMIKEEKNKGGDI